MAEPLVLALGGTRSGKSRFGLARATTLAGDGGRAWFLATACQATRSWTTASHATDANVPPPGRRSRSGGTWPAPLEATAPDEPVLIDGLTMWLSAILGDDTTSDAIDPLLDGPVAAALAAIDGDPARSSS